MRTLRRYVNRQFFELQSSFSVMIFFRFSIMTNENISSLICIFIRFDFDFVSLQHQLSGCHIIADNTAAGIDHQFVADVDAKTPESHTAAGIVFAEASSTYSEISSIAGRMCLFESVCGFTSGRSQNVNIMTQRMS